MALLDQLLSSDPSDTSDILGSIGLGFDQFQKDESKIFDQLPQVDLGADVAPRDPNAAQPQADAGAIGDVAIGNRNSAQRWAVQAQAPVPNVAQVQESNRVALDPRKGGTTSRYYTRKLARAIMNDKNASQATRDEQRLQLRFDGAPSRKRESFAPNMGPPPGHEAVQPEGYGLSPNWTSLADKNADALKPDELPPPDIPGEVEWAKMFNNTRSNQFGTTRKGSEQFFNRSTGKLENRQSLLSRITSA